MMDLQLTEARSTSTRSAKQGKRSRWCSLLTAATGAGLALCSARAEANVIASTPQNIVPPDAPDLTDGAATRNFGSSVSIDGDTAVVGANGATGAPGAFAAGAVYIFVRSGATWQPHPTMASRKFIGQAMGDGFGTSVALSGQTLIVGAPGHNSNAGAVYAYHRAGTAANTAWTLEQTIAPSTLAQLDDFGGTVSVSGTSFATAAKGDTSSTGAVYVFLRGTGSSPWTQQGSKLTAPTAAPSDEFGFAISISGDNLAVGAPGNQSLAFMFHRTGTTWAAGTSLAVNPPLVIPSAADGFGQSLALGTDSLVIGANNANDGVGAAYFFSRSGTTWTATQRVVPPTQTEEPSFGTSVALSGNRAAVGAPSDLDAGSIYMYELNGGVWQGATATAHTGLSYSVGLGGTVAVSSDTLIGGAAIGPCTTGDDCTYDGTSYVFSLSSVVTSLPLLGGSTLGLVLALSACGACFAYRRREPERATAQ